MQEPRLGSLYQLAAGATLGQEQGQGVVNTTAGALRIECQNLTTLENVPLGALTIILVDADTGLAIWGGVASAEIQENPSQETVKKRLEYAVTKMFKQLPN